jgi:pyruvate kinase
MRRTKIIGTIGPASDNIATIKQLVLDGLDVARLNMSHGSQADQKRRIDAIRQADKNLSVLVDLQGPKIRTGKLKTGHITLHTGSIITITTKQIEGDEDIVSTTYSGLPNDVKFGDRILLDDGLIELKVEKVVGSDVVCKVVNGGILKDFKGLNIPGVAISAKGLTAKDKQDLLFAIREKVDFIAMSFVRTAKDVDQVKNIIKKKGSNIPVIAKIEKPEALDNLEEIIKTADGIMIARGDLGVEMSPEKVPIIQKQIISKCNYFGKTVITATQMLESMVVNPRPTRAEASDVANAVFDKTDALMLSEEVAVGKYPVESVRTMSRIAQEVEKTIYTTDYNPLGKEIVATTASGVAHAACHLSYDLSAKAIITFTSSGSTALMVSKFRPSVPIYAVSIDDSVIRRLRLYWGVFAIKIGRFKNTDEMTFLAEKVLSTNKKISKGDIVILVAGVPVGRPGTTNLIKVHKIGDPVSLKK